MISYEQIEKPVLGDLGVRTKAQFLDIASALRTSFERRQAELGEP